MKKHPRDRHLGPPSEANRDKHVNFVALENRELDPADDFEDLRGAPQKKGRRQSAKYRGAKRGNPR